MKIPIVFGVEGYHTIEWIIRLDKNIYGLKDAGLAWFKKLKEGLEAREFFQYQMDPSVWFRDEMFLLLHVEYCLMFSTSKDKIYYG